MSSLTHTVLSALSAFYAQSTPQPRFSTRSRTARRLVAADDHEAWLMAWLPGQSTELHDHGGDHLPAEAGFTVVSGRLREYTVVPGEFPGLSSHEVAEGESVSVSPRTIHAVRNDSTEPAVSVHVYAPKLVRMRSYLFDETGLSLGAIRRAGADW
ncbi:cysteine dioxygenase family protein [Phytomonospora sp. NPDC050363]|uniref:cysteine dioxygenase n=1 Tax=Phytomonospora sp. NPDC050363 TaxID=3155642 RepID=UPI0033F73B57